MRLSTSLCAGLLLSVFSGEARAKSVDSVIATVNGEAIYRSEFEKNWGIFAEQQAKLLSPEQLTFQWEVENKKLLLNEMVEQKLLLQEAKKQNVKVAKKDLEEGIRQVRERFKVDEEGRPVSPSQADTLFQKELKKEGISEKEFHSRIEDQLRVITMTNEVIRNKVLPPGDAQVAELFEKVKTRMAEEKPKASDDPRQSDLDALGQYFRMKTAEGVRVRHILFKVDAGAGFPERVAARKRADEARAKLGKGMDFEEAAQKFSEDPGSAKSGGDLGFVVRGQMMKSFETVAFATPVGETSDVFETEFGYHILKVEEKKAPSKLRPEDVKEELKEYLFRTAAREEYTKFLESVRKKAVVDVRADFAKPN